MPPDVRLLGPSLDNGGDQPHNNMGPTFALYPCKKIADDPTITAL